MTEQNNNEWVLVPREPTQEMRHAYDHLPQWDGNDGPEPDAAWHAMLAAAPTPPSTDRLAALEAVEAIIAKHLDGAIRAAGRGHDTIPVNIVVRDISEMRDEIRAALSASDNGKEGK